MPRKSHNQFRTSASRAVILLLRKNRKNAAVPAAAADVPASPSTPSIAAIQRSLSTAAAAPAIFPEPQAVVALQRVCALVRNGCCSVCLSAMELTTGAVNIDGSASLPYKCARCEEGFEDKLPRVKGLDGTLSSFMPTNVCAVDTTIINGSGHPGCVAMCNALNLPMLYDMSYLCHAKFLYFNM